MKKPSPAASKSRAKTFLGVAGILFVVFLLIALIIRGTSTDTNKPSTRRQIAVQLEVLNGTNEPGAAERLTNTLRAGGFDVVDVGNYKSSTVARTTVIARTADQSSAATVASYLGVEKAYVLHQPDKSLYLDVSVIVGRDMNQLRIFR